MSYYDILGIPHDASQEEIRKAYLEQIKFFHPDVFDGPPEVASLKSAQLNEAYEILKNPQKRQAYDFKLFGEEQSKERKEQKNQNNQNREQKKENNQEEKKENGSKGKEKEDPVNCKKEEAKGQSAGLQLACFLSTIICLVLILACVTQYQEIKNMEEYTELLESRVDSLQDRVNYYKNIADQYSESDTFSGNSEKMDVPDYVFITKSGECYHRAGCEYISISATEVYILDAIAQGYRPCSYCLP